MQVTFLLQLVARKNQVVFDFYNEIESKEKKNPQRMDLRLRLQTGCQDVWVQWQYHKSPVWSRPSCFLPHFQQFIAFSWGESHLHTQIYPPLLAMTRSMWFCLSKALVRIFIKFDLHILKMPKALISWKR